MEPGSNINIDNLTELMLSQGIPVRAQVIGGSMRPYLRGDGGDAVFISPCSPEDLKPGAIVFFRYCNRYVCHRIIAKEGDKIITQGDGILHKKEIISPSDILGVVRNKMRNDQKIQSTETPAAKLYWRCWRLLAPIRKYLLLPVRIYYKITN